MASVLCYWWILLGYHAHLVLDFYGLWDQNLGLALEIGLQFVLLAA